MDFAMEEELPAICEAVAAARYATTTNSNDTTALNGPQPHVNNDSVAVDTSVATTLANERRHEQKIVTITSEDEAAILRSRDKENTPKNQENTLQD
jgi:hypothetical protein